MGCCTTNLPNSSINYKFEDVISELLSRFPLTNYSGNYIKSQFETVQKNLNEDDKIKVKKEKGFQFNDNDYYVVIEFLYQIRHPEKNLKNSILKMTNNLENLRNISMNTNNLSSSSLVYTKDQVQTQNQTQIELINKLIYAITPNIIELHDKIIKDKPKSSFLLFAIGFSKDDKKKKYELLNSLVEASGQRFTLSALKSIIQKYIQINLNFSIQLLDCILKEMRLMNVTSLTSMNLVEVDITDWHDYNIYLSSRIQKISQEFAFNILKDLLIIVKTDSKEKSMPANEFITKNKAKFDNLSYIEVNEMINLYKDPISENDFVYFLSIHQYLFSSSQLRKELKEVIGYFRV